MALFDALDVSIYVHKYLRTYRINFTTVPFVVQLLDQMFPAIHLSIKHTHTHTQGKNEM